MDRKTYIELVNKAKAECAAKIAAIETVCNMNGGVPKEETKAKRGPVPISRAEMVRRVALAERGDFYLKNILDKLNIGSTTGGGAQVAGVITKMVEQGILKVVRTGNIGGYNRRVYRLAKMK